MKYLNIFLILALILPASLVKGQDIISAAETAKLMKNDNVVVVSTRTAADYKKVHITGSVHISHSTLYKEGPIKNMLNTPQEMAKVLGEAGISESNTIILYDDGTGKYAGRLYWILSYLGAKDVKVLNGHMKAWRAARKPVTKNPTNVKAVTFTPKIDKTVIASMAEVKSGGAAIVDARSPEEYKGTAATELRKGHIPGSINLEYTNMMDAQGKLKSNEALQKIFNDAGITKDKKVIVYCESGVRAGIIFLALKSALKYPNVKVYDGAYSEWQSVSSNKVAI
jgi:thiosulfate/3-mercaptopyruvate sulfurtransferase